jgi:hypothetical protein
LVKEEVEAPVETSKIDTFSEKSYIVQLFREQNMMKSRPVPQA